MKQLQQAMKSKEKHEKTCNDDNNNNKQQQQQQQQQQHEAMTPCPSIHDQSTRLFLEYFGIEK